MAYDHQTDLYSPSEDTPVRNSGPFTATIVGHQDSTFMGRLQVILKRPTGNANVDGQTIAVDYISPFYGVTGVAYIGSDKDNDDYNNTQKSYGMWMVPPDVGTTVMVIFANGDFSAGYWFGCVQDQYMNFMVPGLAATQNVVDGDGETRESVAEYNKNINSNISDTTKFKKPRHYLADVIGSQGLAKDDIRGTTTSSARRETPSLVFGISTPGPIDKRPDAKRGPVGTREKLISNYPVSRLGGTTFVMDDGDSRFLRKTLAAEGPPEYAEVNKDESDGNVTLPHNELVRIRTRTGHQILLHNTEDLIYIGNASGTTWIELTSNGKIDIYAKDSISVHTKQDINFLADRDINLEANRNINMKAAGWVQVETGDNFNLIIAKDGFITTTGSLQVNTTEMNNFTSTGDTNIKSSVKINFASAEDTNILAGAKLTQNAAAYYSLPGGGGVGAVTAVAMDASTASALLTFDNIYNANGDKVVSIMKRVPNAEPWPQHENLDPATMTAEKTDREDTTPITFSNGKTDAPDFYATYTTASDTFNKEAN
jgi:hypothetical protein